MMFTSSILALGLAVSIARAVPVETITVDTGSGYKNYPVGQMMFSGNIGGHQLTMNGSIQEVYAYAESQWGWKPTFKPTADNVLARGDAESLDVSNVVARDGSVAQGGKLPPPLCWPVAGQDWEFTNAGRIEQGITYLNGVTAAGWKCGVGATQCVRISCSWKAAIWLCNDNPYAIQPNCDYMGSYAWDIVRKCVFYDSQGTGYVCGQEFDSDGYNIIVRYDASNGC